jgi:DNA-binding cell septation regulator SpoVG
MLRRNQNQQQETQQETQQERTVFDCKVTRVRETQNGAIYFDMTVNGVCISECRYVEYKTKEGKDGQMISFPSYQSKKNQKWYNYVWFPISKELRESIEVQISDLLDSGGDKM